MKLATHKTDYNTSTSVDLFWPRKNRQGCLKVKMWLHYSYSVHDNGGNTSNLPSHFKNTPPNFAWVC